MKESPEFRSSCALSCSLDLIGDRWSLLILRDMILFQKKTFKEFLASEEKIATNILSDRLAKLQERDLIVKSNHPENNKVNLYNLTKVGAGLIPVIVEFLVWFHKNSENYNFIIPESRKFIREEYERDREGLIKKIEALNGFS